MASPKRSLGNLAPCTLDDLAKVIRSWLKRLRYRPDLLDAQGHGEVSITA
ncbi:hypothetical protein ACGFJC_54155 [Nonomuraea fuscirosea]